MGLSRKLPARTLKTMSEFVRKEREMVEGTFAKKLKHMEKNDIFPPERNEFRHDTARKAVIRQRLQFHKMREIIQDASGTPSLSRRRLSQHAQEVHANMQNSAELGIQHNLQVQELMLEEILSHGKPHKHVNVAKDFPRVDAILQSGPKFLIPFKEALWHRFDTIFEAWAYFDLDGDWELTAHEFRVLFRGLRFAKEMVAERIFEHLDKEKTGKMNPFAFARALCWHHIPSYNQGIQEFLEEAKRRRKTIAQAAVRRTLDLNKELAAHARAEGSHAGSPINAKTKTPRTPRTPRRVVVSSSVSAPSTPRFPATCPLPFSPRYPKFNPIVYRGEKRAASNAEREVLETDTGVHDLSLLPDEILEFNKQLENDMFNTHHKHAKLNRLRFLQSKRVGLMLSLECCARGRAWKLNDGAEKSFRTSWVRVLLVLTEDGVLIYEPEEAEEAEKRRHEGLALKHCITHESFDFPLFPGGGVQLVLRFRSESDRRTETLCLAWDDGDQDVCKRWEQQLRRFTWRAGLAPPPPDIPEDRELWAQLQDKFQRIEWDKASRRLQRWFRARATGRRTRREVAAQRLAEELRAIRCRYIQTHTPR